MSQRVNPQNGLNNANATYNSALQAANNANSALVKAQQDAKAKQEAEARRQAEAAAKLKAANEAEAKRKADEQAKAKAAADAVTKAAALEAAMSMLEQPNVFAVRGLAASNSMAIAPMTFAETGLGSLTFTTEGASLSWIAVRSAISKLLMGTIINSGMATVLASIIYVPKAGVGSDKIPGRNNINMFSTVMDPSVINLSDESKIKQALKNGGEISSELSARVYFDDNEFRTELIRTPKPTMIKVVQAVKDTVTGLYGYTIPSDGGLPSRTILISPSDVPGVGGLPPLVNPIETKIGFTNTGNQNQPPESFSIETYPLEDEPDFSHLILVFEGLNLKPLYVVFQDSLDDGKYTRKQLDKKFKHAPDFGVNDLKKNKETLTKFRDALDDHLSDVNTVEKGTYILSKDSKVFYNPNTKNVVVLRDDGMFVSGWKLIPNTAQYINYIENGVLR